MKTVLVDKEAELLKDRIDTLSQVESYVGTFFSKQFVLKKVLNMNDAQIAEMQDQIKKESAEDDEDDEGDFQ